MEDHEHQDYRGTLTGMIFLTNYSQSSATDKTTTFQEFSKDKLVLFLYKSRKKLKEKENKLVGEDSKWSRDSFVICKMDDLGTNIFDSREHDIKFH